jgi:hypothetical protein
MCSEHPAFPIDDAPNSVNCQADVLGLGWLRLGLSHHPLIESPAVLSKRDN